MVVVSVESLAPWYAVDGGSSVVAVVVRCWCRNVISDGVVERDQGRRSGIGEGGQGPVVVVDRFRRTGTGEGDVQTECG